MELEDLHRVVVQGFASVSDRFDSVDARLTSRRIRIDSLDARLSDWIDSRNARLSGRIDSLDASLSGRFRFPRRPPVGPHRVTRGRGDRSQRRDRSLRAELTAFRHDFDHREDLGRLRALETRVTAIESKLGLPRDPTATIQ